MTGELQRQNRNCSQSENAVDFRERDSRSIWRSEPRLSCCRILLAGVGLLFVGEVPLCEYVLENPRCFLMIYSSKGFPTNPD